MQILRACLTLALLGWLAAAQLSFTVVSSAASPNTARSSSSTYTITMNAITSASLNFDASVSFTSAFVFSSLASCQVVLNSNVVPTASCSLATGSNMVQFANLNPTLASVSTLALVFTTATALYAGSFTATLTYYASGNSSNVYNTNSAPISITSAPMSCSLASTSATTGATANYTLGYSPSVYISPASILQVQFPSWSAYSQTNFPSFTSSAVCAGQCTIRTPSQVAGFNNEVITYSSLYSANSTANMSLTLANARNPASTQPISVSLTLLHYVSSTSQPVYMTCTTTFAASSPNTFKGVAFAPSNLAIAATNAISLLINLTNPISSISYLRVSYAADLTLAYSYVSSNQQTTQVSISSGASNTLLIGNLTNSTSLFSTLFMAFFTLTNAPFANYSLPITFATLNLVGTSYYQVDSTTVNLQFTQGTLPAASVTAADPSINAVTTYTLTMTTLNTLIANSKIILTLPAEVTSSAASSCSCSAGSTCSLTNNSTVVVNLNGVVMGETTLTITLNALSNPPTTTPSSTFGLATYYYNTSTPTDVLNTLATPLTITADPVTLSTVTLTSSSAMVAAAAAFTVTIQPSNALPSGSSFKISFPTASFSTAATPTLLSVSVGGVAAGGSCTMTSTGTLSFNFTSCLGSGVAKLGNIVVVINSMINPYSTKPTSPLTAETYFNSRLMESLTAGVLTLTTPTTLLAFAAAPASATVNAVTTYAFTLSFRQTHYSLDRLLLTLPAGITVTSGFSCSSNATGVSTSCSQNQQNSQLLVITLAGPTTLPSTVTVSVSGLQNNWYVQTLTVSVQTTTNDNTTYLVEQATATATFTPAALAATHTPSNSLVLLATSSLTLTITNTFAIAAPTPTLLRIVIVPPAQLTLLSSGCTLSLTGSVCTPTVANITLTQLTSFSNTISLTFSANASYFSTTGAFSFTLSYNGSTIATNTVLTVSSFCVNPCKSCTTAAQCLSCLPTPYTSFNYLFAGNSSCVSACPNTFFLPTNSTTCTACNASACLNCVGTASTCTACATPTFLMNTSCLLTCPNTYYGSNNLCVPCVNQCYNCTNSTYCLTCQSGYSLNPPHTCLSSCPTGYASIAAVCQACSSTCVTCVGTINTCTGCLSTLILYNSTCIANCPLGMFNNSNTQCQACESPCRYCFGAVNCSTCVTGYFLYNGSQCVSTCPAGTYLRTSACELCNPICATCFNTANNCTSCNSSLYYYLGNCYSTCPNLTYPYLGTCTTCVTPCASCLNGAFSCSSCVNNYYLLNTSCLSSCPSVGYLTLNASCVTCPTNCLRCVSSISCSICASGYLQYQGSCLSNCPTNSPIVVNQTCTGCNKQCATCANAPDECLTCTVYYYKYTYTCVQSCPLSYYSNQLTYACESGLSSKIVFFPVLITYVVIIAVMAVVKCFTRQTSLITVLSALSGWLEISIWAYLLSLLFQTYLQPDLTYALPQALLIIAFFSTALGNFVHFRVSFSRLQDDEFARKWQDINLNNTYLKVIRWTALFTHHRFFRLIYSKIFHSIHFSLVVRKHPVLFTPSTLSTIYALILSELPAIVASFYLAYNKLLKDQVFYSACETLIITLVSLLLSLIDIYKPQDYFEDTEFMQTKRYLEKVNNESLNKLEDEYRDKDEGSMDGEKMIGTSGGKFIFSKQDPSSMNELLFEEASAATDAHGDTKKKLRQRPLSFEKDLKQEDDKDDFYEESEDYGDSGAPPMFSSKSSKQKGKLSSRAKINIFQPIQQEEAEYYQVLKYDEEDFKTMAKIEKQQIEGNESQQQNQLEQERREEFGMNDAQSENDDNRSLMQYRERREKWNNIIEHRENLARQIFNTVDTKELYKALEKIEEPPNEDEEREEELISEQKETVRIRQNIPQEQEEEIEEHQPQGSSQKKKGRRKRKGRNGNKQLEQIYLQRLAERVPDPKRKTHFASSKSFKYEF